MDKPTIGIRIANGTFFPILRENDTKRKKIILSPVRENQKDVKIDIFRGEGEGMLDPVYVASLILNNISQESDQPVEIQLLVHVSDEGILDAEAFEPLSDVKQFLSISLDSIEENAGFYDMSDSDSERAADISASMDQEDFFSDEGDNSGDSAFDDFDSSDEGDNSGDSAFDDFDSSDENFDIMDQSDETLDRESEEDEDENSAWLYEAEKKCNTKNRLLKLTVMILGIIFIILLGLLLYTLFMKPALAKNRMDTPAAVASAAEPAVKPEIPVQAAPSEPVIKEEPAVSAPVPAPPAPVAAEPVKKAPESVRYRIKWGDTLWDISKTYYRTPWLYKKIARDNKIKNPDLIFAETYINIKSE
ncbi:MAG: LysM peptidoglycan-binding domain-containing protein [Spirochaetia bacterium]|nr:LysM peptidoglycan-binding domain-containing protein [Spirochaetia bacterium]